MGSNKIYLILVLLFFIVAFSVYQYIFSIYEVTYKVMPDKLYADNSSTLEIQVVPINAFGWKAPFRTSQTEFSIKEGEDLVIIIYQDNNNGVIKLRAKDKPGKVSITLKSKYSLFPTTLEIIIEPNIA